MTATETVPSNKRRSSLICIFDQYREDEEKMKAASQLLTDFPGLTGAYSTILIDPPWRFLNRTGKVAPEHRRLHRYKTMSFEEISNLPVAKYARRKAHLYMWCPNALLLEGLSIMKTWGFTYKTKEPCAISLTQRGLEAAIYAGILAGRRQVNFAVVFNIVWYKIRKDGGPDGRGVGFYFRNVTELLLFGTRGSMRTLAPGRRQVNIIMSRKEEHSRKPSKAYYVIEQCSPGPYLELFARERVEGWTQWGDQVDSYQQTRPNYKGYRWADRGTERKELAIGYLF